MSICNIVGQLSPESSKTAFFGAFPDFLALLNWLDGITGIGSRCTNFADFGELQ